LGGVALGYSLGVREGEYLGYLAEAPATGWFAVTALGNITAGQMERPRSMYELQVDWGLLSLHEFDESTSVQLASRLLAFNPRSSSMTPITNDYATKMAEYRKVHPSPFQGKTLTHFDGETAQQRLMIDQALERQREKAQIIDAMIKLYSSK
jgi:hypothetical protein